MIDPYFQLGFHMELRKIAAMMPNQPEAPAVQQVNMAQSSVNSGQFPRPPQTPNMMQGPGAGGSQFADMAAGPNPGTRAPGAP